MNLYDTVYKKGYDLEKIIPDNINPAVVIEWVNGRKVISYKVNTGNFLIACIDESNGTGLTNYCFLRFVGDVNNTHCSVDFESNSEKELIQKLTSLLNHKHTF